MAVDSVSIGDSYKNLNNYLTILSSGHYLLVKWRILMI